MGFAWMNNRWVEEADASLSIRDTGLLHAAGVFTTMRAYRGKVFRIRQHLQRVRRSCEALFIPLQYPDEVIFKAADELLRRNDLQDARMRLTVTRGAARQDPVHGLRLEPSVFMTATTLEPYPQEFYERGMTAVLLDEQKLNPFDMQAGHKTLNYFSLLAGLRAANQRGAGEALWFDVFNNLQSGSISNVFVVKEDRLLTPPTTAEVGTRTAVLPGITRGVVIELAESLKIPVERAGIDVNGLLDADEVFITNSIMGVMPVCRLERRVIGDDRPGPITRTISDEYAALIDRDLRSSGEN